MEEDLWVCFDNRIYLLKTVSLQKQSDVCGPDASTGQITTRNFVALDQMHGLIPCLPTVVVTKAFVGDK